MDSRKKTVARYMAVSGVTVALGLIVWALIAFAAAQVQTYSDATYTTVKTKFGRGIDPVYSRMSNGFNGATYYAEQWGSVWESYTSVPPVEYYTGSRSGPKTADANGVCTDVFNSVGTENAGMWQVRYFHNPQYTNVGRIIIDSPNPNSTLSAGTPITDGVGNDSFKFHLVDRDGNIITTDHTADLSILAKDGSTVVWRNKSPDAPKNNRKDGWSFTGGYYEYARAVNDGGGAYIPLANDDVLELEVTYVLGTEAGDTYSMGDLVEDAYWKVGAITPDTYPYSVVPVDSLNPKFVGNPTGTTYAYTYYFDIFDYQGNALTSGTYTWTRTAIEAMDYDADTLQTSVTGTVPTYDATAGHWKSTITLNAPGKYLFKYGATMVNSPECNDIINFGATKQYEMAGDVTPPGEVTWGNYSGVDNVVGMDWTNPGDADFNGVLILRNTVSIAAGDTPQQGVIYDPTGAGGPATINTSRVVFVGNNVSYSDGDPCLPSKRLVNGTTYYYKAFTFDNNYNYSSGLEISATPTDTVIPGTATGVGFIEGDKENTVTWTNPSDCDFAGVTIRYRTDGTFPSARNGSDGSILAGTKLGGTPGAADSFLHTSLTNGTPYFYSVWTQDDDGNWNETPMSPATYASPHDVTPPNQITDLSVVGASTTAFDITVQWTSPGDDGIVGQAKKYDIRYYDQPVTAGNWGDAWPAVGAAYPDPQPYGATQSYKIAGLSPLTQYYFGITAVDESGNVSPVSSPSPTDSTLCNEELSDCNQCHLLPPYDALPGAHPRGTGNVGSHDLPIHASADPKQCNVCHANGEVFDEISGILHYGFNHQNDKIDMSDPGMIGNLAERQTVTGGTFYPETTIVYKYKNYSSGVGYKQLTGYCQNTYCHGAGLSSPQWGLGKIVCGEFCHETPPATGRHVKHYHPGQYYLNMAPASSVVSGYVNYSGTGWSGAPTFISRGGANVDQRYDTFMQTSSSQKTYVLPDGTWYITVCVGDPTGPVTGQTVQISGNGGITWDTLIDNFDTMAQKLFKKVVDHEFIVTGGNNLVVKVGNGSAPTDLNFMIINATPEAPKENTTLLQNTPSEYGFACGKCHVDDITQARHTEHVHGAYQEGVRDAEVYFDGNAFPKNPLAVYTTVGLANISSLTDGQGFDYTTGHSCVNTYCHGNTLNAGGTNTTPTWHNAYIDVGGASLCGACHDTAYADSSPMSNITTGSHDKHVDIKYGYEFDCYKCHYHTVGPKNPLDGDKITIVDKTHHVNGDVDLEFDPNDNSMKFGHYSTTVKTCIEVYCHSNGLLTPAGEPASYTKYREPVWNSGSKSCNYCHGTSRSDGMPDYFNSISTPNSHVAHVDENHQGCSMCHNNTTRDDGLTIYTGIKPGLHVNVNPDVTFSALNTGASFDNGNLQCSNTYCHGLTAPPTWGGVATCGSCHGDGVFNPNPGIGQHDLHNNGNHNNISTINANASTQTNYDFDCRFCHFQRTHGAGPANPGIRAAEVNFNTIDVANGYNNTGGQYFEGSTTFTDAGGWNFTNAQCSVSCHSDGRGGPPNNTTYKWTNAAGTLGCYGCHNGGAAAPAGERMDSHNHSKHVWADVYRKACQDCHEPTVTGSNTITDRSKHVNGQPDVGLSVVWGGSYNQADMTCSNNQCHWNGDPFWNGTGLEVVHYTMMNWTTSVTTTCTTCHSDSYHPSGDLEGRTAKQTLSFNHAKHVNAATDPNIPGYGSRFGCTMCHNKTAASNTLLQPTVPTSHNNQQKDVVYNTDFMYNMTGFNCADPRTGYWGEWNTPVPGNCTVICHSRWGFADVTSVTKSNIDPYRFPNWSSVNYGCNGCHGDRFANLTSGSHTAHIAPAGQNFDCGVCHAGTAKNDYPNNDGQEEISLSGYNSMHLNNFTSGFVDVILSPFSNNTGVGGSWDNVTRTCTTTNSNCHDTGSPVWGTAATCVDCHGVASNETNDTSYIYQNGTKSTISLEEYTSIGHGRKTGTYAYSGNTGASDPSQGARQITGCENNQCHTNTSFHNDTTTPDYFRLSYANVDDVCTTLCHPSSQVDHHNQVNTGGDADWNFTPKCVDCHDPHGDKNTKYGRDNSYMIQGYINYTTASTSDGRPLGGIKAVAFPDDATLPGSLDEASFVNASFGGICQICHTAGGNPANYSRDLYTTSHSGGMACTDCHSHAAGFKGAGDCMGCHGTGGAGTNAGKDDIQLAFSAKSHHAYGNWTTFSGEECYACHYEANVDGTPSADHDKNGVVKLRQWTGAWGNETNMSAVNYQRGVTADNAVNAVCEGCHNATNASATPFSTTNGISDTGTPGMYDTASGGANAGSVSERWSVTTTSSFSKYNPNVYNVVPQITKAYSPHANPGNNQRGVVTSGTWSDDNGTSSELACIDCHNSHGSDVGATATLPLTSYSGIQSGWMGGNLKETSTYDPTEDTNDKAYSASADLCFDCHVGGDATAPKTYSTFGYTGPIESYYDAGRWQTADTWTPTFSYKTAGTGNGAGTQKGGHFGASSALATTPSKSISGRCTMCHDPHGIATGVTTTEKQYRLPALKGTWMASPYKEDRAGGVSGIAEAGSGPGNDWTSSTRQGTNHPSRFNPRYDYNNPPLVGAGFGSGDGTTNWGTGGSGADGYFIDDNTFGTDVTNDNNGDGTITDDTSSRRPTQSTAQHISESDTNFAGLCMTCHVRDGANGILEQVSYTVQNGDNNPTVYVHNTVKGWAGVNGNAPTADLFRPANANMHMMMYGTSSTSSGDMRCSFDRSPYGVPSGYRWSPTAAQGRVLTSSTYTTSPPPVVANTQSTSGYKQAGFHQFPCSKCHAAHTSKLPRLMKTNCLDVGTSTSSPKHNSGYTYPNCDNPGAAGSNKEYMTQCHNLKKSNTSTGGGWNTVTGWQ